MKGINGLTYIYRKDYKSQKDKYKLALKVVAQVRPDVMPHLDPSTYQGFKNGVNFYNYHRKFIAKYLKNGRK